MRVCPLCHHLLEENHACPDEEYLLARDYLVKQAARADELFTREELEAACAANAEAE